MATPLYDDSGNSLKGAVNGYAGLDAGGLVPVAQLPALQATLVSGTNIKTINGSTVLGSGDLVVAGAAAWGSVTGTLSAQTDLQTALDAKQATLVSATNIKTINSASILGSGNLPVSAGDPSYSPGSFTVATETQRLAPHRLNLTTTQRITIEGTGRLSCYN